MRNDQKLFEDIRPYKDCEVKMVKKRILQSTEFTDILIAFFAKKYSSFIPRFLLRSLIKCFVHFKWLNVKTVSDVQMHVTLPFLINNIKATETEFTYRELEKLTDNESYLFISNHRDIVMDPTFTCYALHLMKLQMVRIGIGDNLLGSQLIEDLMRINRSYVIRRNGKSMRDKIRSITQLSSFINHSIQVEKKSIWIAQQEGRAKNNCDRSDADLLKMFHLSKKKIIPFADCLNELNIVGISISYEWDPCDLMKAREIYITQNEGFYQKQENEDTNSIIQGITGRKGLVNLTFSPVISFHENDTLSPSEKLDQQIIGNYQIMPTHFAAFDHLYHHGKVNVTEEQLKKVNQWRSDFQYSDSLIVSRFKQLQQRLKQAEKEEIYQIALQNYANPILNRLDFESR